MSDGDGADKEEPHLNAFWLQMVKDGNCRVLLKLTLTLTVVGCSEK